MKLHKRATKSEYLGLLVYEAFLVQEIEINQRVFRNKNEVIALNEEKAAVSIQRKRMKMVLENKKQQVLQHLPLNRETIEKIHN